MPLRGVDQVMTWGLLDQVASRQEMRSAERGSAEREKTDRERERLLKEISSDGRVKFMCHREREHTLAQWDVKCGLRVRM